MATRITDGPTGQGRGISVCTLTGGSRLVDNMKLGPDGANWDLLDNQEIGALFNGQITFRHVPKQKVPHLCSGKGTWAFQVFTSSSPHGVVFLHIRPPQKLVEVMGSDPNIMQISGATLLTSYNYAELGSRNPRVWRRNVPGWDEIAINFCVKND